MSSRWLTLIAVGLGLVLWVGGLNPAVAQTPVLGVWKAPSDPGLDGTSELWQAVPPTTLSLSAQQTAPPMGGGTVRFVTARALHWEGQLYVMLEWPDPTPDVGTFQPESFSDAAAIQFPSRPGTAVPAICMGQADQAMNIWHWRADSQAGIPDQPADGYVDLYPSTDDLYYPARQAGNVMTVTRPVQNLAAGGFGTLTPLPEQVVDGHGLHHEGRWSVVFTRDLASPGGLQPPLGETAIDTAFAVWDGSEGERNGIKSVSGFVQLQVSGEPPPEAGVSGSWMGTALVVGIMGALVVLLGAAAVTSYRSLLDE